MSKIVLQPFPAYVPAAVRSYCHAYADRLAELAARGRALAAQMRTALDEPNARHTGNRVEVDAALLEEFFSLEALNRNCNEHQFSVLNRLVFDERMSEGFALLSSAMKKDADWKLFCDASLTTLTDFDTPRAALARSNEIKTRLLNALNELTEAITAAQDPVFEHLNVPKEITELPGLVVCRIPHLSELLATSDTAFLPDDLPYSVDFQSALEMLAHKPHSGASRRSTIGTTLPDVKLEACALTLKTLVVSVTEAIRGWSPKLTDPLVEAAISRQRNRKTEFLRALMHKLKSLEGSQSPRYMRGIAVAATVVINDPDVVVQYVDVRNALAATKS